MQRTAPDRPHDAPIAALAHLPLDLATRTAGAIVSATADVQQDMARRAGELQRQACLRMVQAAHPGELAAAQAEWMVAGWQHAIDYGQQLAQVWLTLGQRPPARH